MRRRIEPPHNAKKNRGAQTELENLGVRKNGYDASLMVRHVRLTCESLEQEGELHELTTGFQQFDEKIGGIPKREAFITLPGKPNQGKTSLLANLAWRVVDHNDNAMVFVHSVDDAMGVFVPRLWGSKFGLPSNWFKKAGYYGKEQEGFAATFCTARGWLDHLLEEERLVLADVKSLPADLPSLEVWIRQLRQRFPKRDLVVMCDNFHLYSLPGLDDGEAKTREMSKYCKRLANDYACTLLMTMELPKESLRPGVRPRVRNIKGSSGLAFDSNLNLGVYNDLKDFGIRSEMFWSKENDLEMTVGPSGEQVAVPRRRPVVEVVIDKNKITGYDGAAYFRLDENSGRYEECSAEEQRRLRKLADAALADGVLFPPRQNGAGNWHRNLVNWRAPYRPSFTAPKTVGVAAD